eukprot:3925697-Amphidinium_carterae.1
MKSRTGQCYPSQLTTSEEFMGLAYDYRQHWCSFFFSRPPMPTMVLVDEPTAQTQKVQTNLSRDVALRDWFCGWSLAAHVLALFRMDIVVST